MTMKGEIWRFGQQFEDAGIFLKTSFFLTLIGVYSIKSKNPSPDWAIVCEEMNSKNLSEGDYSMHIPIPGSSPHVILYNGLEPWMIEGLGLRVKRPS